MDSIFKILKDEGLTTLELRYNHKSDQFFIEARKEWDEGTDFSEYNKAFITADILTDQKRVLNKTQFENLIEKNGIGDYYNDIKQLIREGKHEAVKLFYNDKLGIEFAMFEHNTVVGRGNRLHAITCGGIRRHLRETPERDVFVDGLNLGRAMTFKNAGAQIPFGGSKITLQAEILDLEDDETLGFIGYATDRCNVVTAPDMNLPPYMSDKMQEKNYSCSYVGGENSKTGKTGKPTAYGVYLSLKEAVRFTEGADSLKDKTILVIGLGAVGWNMAEYVLEDGADLYVCDINKERIEQFVNEHTAKAVKVISPEDALTANVEIISPCAAGGLLDEETIENLKCRYVWGSANNQLKATSIDEEYRLAEVLKDKGIVYQSEWWHNSAGVICMAEEYVSQSTPDQVLRRVEETIPHITWENLQEAKDNETTPTYNCYSKIKSLIF